MNWLSVKSADPMMTWDPADPPALSEDSGSLFRPQADNVSVAAAAVAKADRNFRLIISDLQWDGGVERGGFGGYPAQAGFIMTLTEQGSNVVATGSGTLDVTDLIFSLA